MMNKSMVSCVIPTYKRCDTLIRAIESVLNQTYKNVEVLVVDDNDPNDQYSLMVQDKLMLIKDSRVRYIQQEKHINGAVARNVGIRHAKGEYVAFLDDDDEWLEKKLELQITVLEQYREYSGVSCLYTMYANNNPLRRCPPYTGDDLHRKVLERSVAVFTSTTVFRKDPLDKSGGFDECMVRHQDLQLLLDFLENNKIIVVSEYLVLLHTDIGGNRPNTEKFIQIKDYFLEKMKRHIKKYDKKTQKKIYTAHYFEVILVAMREKKYNKAILYLLKVGIAPRAYCNLIKRIFERRKYYVR